VPHVFAGQRVGVTQVGERIWLVTFMQYDLGYFDDETCRLEPIENPFGPNSVTPPLGINCYLSDQKGPQRGAAQNWAHARRASLPQERQHDRIRLAGLAGGNSCSFPFTISSRDPGIAFFIAVA
jgi:hypothetical protein